MTSFLNKKKKPELDEKELGKEAEPCYNFAELKKDKVLLEEFTQFLTEHKKISVLRFFKSAKKFQRTTSEMLVGPSARVLFGEYIRDGSNNQVAVSAETKNDIVKDVEQGKISRTTFIKAQQEMLDIMEQELIPKFLQKKRGSGQITNTVACTNS